MSHFTKFIKIDIDWKFAKNECRNTLHKDATDKEPSENFIKQLLISEHSPIRVIRLWWHWTDIKSFISVHFVRHHEGVEKWVSTQRSDRTGVKRDKLPQDSPVDMDMEANAQALITMARFRLCYQAAPETRAYMEDLKESIKDDLHQEALSNVMVPNCIYRYGCPEFKSCGYFEAFLKYKKDNNIEINSIQERYDAYNKYFYDNRKKKINEHETENQSTS